MVYRTAPFSKAHHYSSFNISETIQHRTIVTAQCQYELICDVTVERYAFPLTLSDFKVHVGLSHTEQYRDIFQRQIPRKW